MEVHITGMPPPPPLLVEYTSLFQSVMFCSNSASSGGGDVWMEGNVGSALLSPLDSDEITQNLCTVHLIWEYLFHSHE